MKDPQVYLRHPNGRGKLLDDADVSLSTELGRNAQASGNCQLRDCTVVGHSIITDHARVFGGFIENSIIHGHTVIAGSPVINSSLISCRDITGSPTIIKAKLFDDVTVADNAVIEGITMLDKALVYGDAEIVGNFTLHGYMRIATGIWDRPPRYVDLEFCQITESKLGAMLNCRDRTAEYWFRHGPKFAERYGWSKEHILVALQGVAKVTAKF